MAYKQLVAPNLSAVGRVGWCLEYIARVYGTTQVAPYAWTAWQQTQFKHSDPIPGDVSVPCWFSFYSGGINQGHVVASVPGQGFYSSPWKQGTTHAILPSIAEVERIYGAKYVGWSEDILNKRIVEGADMATSVDLGTARILWFSVLGRDGQDGRPNALNGECDDELKTQVGKDLTPDWVASIYNSPEGQNYINKVQPQVYKDRDASGTVLAPGKYIAQ